MTQRASFLSFTALAALFLTQTAACVPFSATPPARTYRPGEPEPDDGVCAPQSLTDPHAAHWEVTDRAAFDAEMARGEPAVASVLGCGVRVLDRCRAPAPANGAFLARDVRGDCEAATHVVVPLRGGHVSLAPLSLGDFRVEGTFRGVMRQPNGPYESYDMTLFLAQDGRAVNGVSQIATTDGDYHGDLRFEGRLEGNVLFFADTEVLDDDTGLLLGWCAKSGYLIVNPREGRITGPWRAAGCAPGTLDLRRAPDPPRVIIPRSASR